MNSSWKLNFWHLCLGIGLIIAITKATSLLKVEGWYFTFSGALYGVPERPEWPAILIKFGIPVVAGCFIGFLSQDNPIGTAGAVGFSAAFILAWPALVDWKKYAGDLEDREYAFKLVYLFYFVSYYYLAIWGARLTTTYLKFMEQQGQTRTSIIRGILDWEKSVKPLVFGVVGGATSFIFARIFSQ